MRLAALFVALTVALSGQAPGWKTYRNKAGWSIQYPGSLRIASCRQCDDPTTADLVAFQNQREVVMLVENLIGKPEDRGLDQWLEEIARTTNLNPVANRQWITLNGLRALRVTYESKTPQGMESTYLLHGDTTVALSSGKDVRLYRQMISTLRVR